MYKYEVRHGTYFMVDDRGAILRGMDEVAVAIGFDKIDDSYIMHKHGQPESVKAWVDTFVSKMREAGFDDLAEGMILLKGQFPCDEINRLIDNSGYAKKFVEKVQSGMMPLDPNVTPGSTALGI